MQETEPDYKRPFDTDDFRGYFTWDSSTTKAAGSRLYHACHQDELEEVLSRGELILRSTWSLNLPEHGLWESPGVWAGLNYYTNGNRYGPFVIEFPLEVLNGKRFMAFRRTGGRKRFFFVQYEAQIPIYSFESKIWRTVNPKHYFTDTGIGAIWDIVLTQPILIGSAVVTGVEHPSCISGKCNGSSARANRKSLRSLAKEKLTELLVSNNEYASFLKRFDVAEGMEITLPLMNKNECST
ncbi:MAG: hypothetical protein CV088_00585 [Nitrospira sp. LK70]|nr:hypothetical protein [Nitrospira sp. LK70]